MKTSGILLAVALGAALQATAAPPAQNPSISNAAETNAIPSKLVEGQPAAQQKVQIERVPLTQNPSDSKAMDTNAIPSNLMELQPAAKQNVQIERVGNMSSRPWSEIVGWHPGESQFPDAENHEPQALFSVSFGPHAHRQPAISRQSPPP